MMIMYQLPSFNTFVTMVIVITIHNDIILFWSNSDHHINTITNIQAFPLKKLLKFQLKQIKEQNKAKKFGLKKVKYLNVEEHHQHIYLNDYILPKQPRPSQYKPKLPEKKTTTTTTTPKPTTPKYVQPIAAIPVYVPQQLHYPTDYYGDHKSTYEHPYGFDGGHRLLEKKLELKETMPEQLQRVRRKIRECFKEIGCFLMPHPGARVATAQNFDGRLGDYDQDFAHHLRQFVPNLLAPSRIIPKEIGGRPITGRQLLEYFKVYINVFAGDTMPEPKTMLEATAEANNLNAVAVVKDMYTNEMEAICGGNQPYINPTTLEQRHADLLVKCMDEFDTIPKMGGAEYSVSYRERLEEELGQAFEHFAIQNKSKNVFGYVVFILQSNSIF